MASRQTTSQFSGELPDPLDRNQQQRKSSRRQGGLDGTSAASMVVAPSNPSKSMYKSSSSNQVGLGKSVLAVSKTSKNQSSANLNRSALIPGAFQFNSASKLASKNQEPTIKPPKNTKECENFDNLPMTFQVVSKSQYNERDQCQTCPAVFGRVLCKRHHCRVCGFSICSDCSIKRRLSKSDAEVYYVCINCDFELTNSHQLQLYNEVVNQREDLIEQVSSLVDQAEKAIQNLQKKKDQKKAQLQQENKRIEQELLRERKNQKDLELQSNKIEESLHIKTNNLTKLKHESAELKHEIESKRLQINNLNRQMSRPMQDLH